MKFSSVVSYHRNPLTCGVCKFSFELARRLGVPCVGLGDDWGEHALLSLKWSEIDPELMFTNLPIWSHYSVFWHDGGNVLVNDGAQHVFYADPSLGSPGLWCPSLIPPRTRPVRLFSFGMAHKLQTDHYKRVRDLLVAAGMRYHLRVSVGLHEGTSLDGAEKHFDALRDILGEQHVTILGMLSDDAVSEELTNAEYVLAFFEKGVRANNTTVHAARAYGKAVITNFDDHSPLFCGVQDIADMDGWPTPQPHYSWERLIFEMDELCEASPSTTAR